MENRLIVLSNVREKNVLVNDLTQKKVTRVAILELALCQGIK